MTEEFTNEEREELTAWFSNHAVSRTWITRESDGGDGLRLTGFAVNTTAAFEELHFLINDKDVRRGDWKRWPPLADCGPADFRAFRWWPNIEGYGFDIHFYLDELQTFSLPRRGVKIELCNTAGRRICDPAQAVYISPTDIAERLSGRHPPEHLMNRVMGRENALAEWYLTGYCNLRVFDDILREATGQSIASMGPILEWGSGCGRLSRHLIRLPKTSMTGIDIDREAVDWCNDYLIPQRSTRVRFEPCGLLPPTSLATSSFGIAIGVSVITHLNEQVGNAWLAELARLLKPGGYLLLTTHGLDTLSMIDKPIVFRQLKEKGFYSVKSGLLNIILGDHQEYYMETWHSWNYIRRNWSRWFSVVTVRRGGHLGYQDLVVLERTASAAG